MKDGFIICRRMKDGTLKHLTFRESDVILIDDLLERLIQREIPTKTGAKAEDVFTLMNGEQSPEEFLKEHRIDGFGSEAKRPLQAFVRTAKEDTKPLGEEQG